VTPLRALTTASLAIVLAAFALAAPRDASAHARYQSSIPAKGEVVQASPGRVEITFTQEIQRVSGTYDISVEKDRGLTVTDGPAEVHEEDRSTMSVPLQPTLEPGRYVVMWKNVSDADGDPAEGAFSFYVQDPPTEVDLENDADLELIGAEDTPVASGTGVPTAAATAGMPAPPTTERSPSPAPSVTPGDSSPDDDDDGGGASAIIAIVLVVGLVAAGTVAGYMLVQRMRR
jgi:methionine-rich copper-binding protein CopC